MHAGSKMHVVSTLGTLVHYFCSKPPFLRLYVSLCVSVCLSVSVCVCSSFDLLSAQDDYVEALGRLHLTVSRAYRVNPEINFEVFIHKVDGLSDDHKIETQRDIHQRANDDLADASLEKLHLR